MQVNMSSIHWTKIGAEGNLEVENHNKVKSSICNTGHTSFLK